VEQLHVKVRGIVTLGALLLLTLATTTHAAIRVEFPEPGTQVVLAQPGGSATMIVRVTNDGEVAVSPAHVNGAWDTAGPSSRFSYTSLDPARCQFNLNAVQYPHLTIATLGAHETLDCRIRVDRQVTEMVDGILAWIQPGGGANAYRWVIIGERITISAEADTLAIDTTGPTPHARVRLTTTNHGSVPVIGVGFSTCLFVGMNVTAPSTNGCPLTLPAGAEICLTGFDLATFSSPPLAAGATVACEIDVPLNAGPVGSHVHFFQDILLLTPNGRTVYDAAQMDVEQPLIVTLGLPPTAVPTFSSAAFFVLLLLFAMIARRRFASG
jgi:hypothetical protein